MEKDEETISLTRQKKQSAAFTKQPAVLAALQRCARSSISRGTIRKLGGGKIKGNVETNLPSQLHRSTCLVYHFPRPRARRSYLFFVSSSGSRSSSTVTTSRRLTRFLRRVCEGGGGGGEGNLSSFGFQTSAKNVKNNFSFGFFWWIKIIGDVFSRLLIFEN